MSEDNEAVKMYREIREDYAYHEDIFQDDDRMKKLKDILNNKLSVVDKTIILLYAENGSLRKAAKMIGVSHATYRSEIKRIRKLIQQYYEDID